MPKYKFASTHEWFEQFARTKIEEGSSDLYSIMTSLASKLDADQLQDLFESDMDADGFFTPETEECFDVINDKTCLERDAGLLCAACSERAESE